ncbi:MAG: SDR family NAD(P)-dependent oxidoreductase, partial [Gammaproteobacteria bacterium]
MSTHEYGDRFSEAPLFAHEGIKPSFAAKHRMQGEIGDALAALLWASLRALGLSAAGGSIAELEERILAGPLYRKWLRESLLELERRDYLRISGERYQAARVDADDLQGAWAEWERRKEDWCAHADLQAQVALVEQTMRALPAILGARRAATDVIFPDSSLALVEGVYRHNELARHYNDVLADIVERYIHESLAWNPSARLRILEIGAGTGGTSAVVLEKIASYRAHVEEYCYTDISRAFLLHAEERFGADHPFLSYRLFNVEEPLAPQGIEVGSFDIVIAANVLHATRNIANTVRNAKALLAGNGLLVLNEVSRNTLFAHLTFGLLEGWWLYEDAFVRIPGSPALSSQAWQAVLEMEGFRSVFFPAESLHDLGQQIVVAESDGMVRQKAPTQAPAASVPASPRAPMVQDSAAAPLQPQATLAAAVAYFRSLVAETLKMSSADIDPAEPLERYGLDSILIVKMTGKLKDSLGPVSSTLLFEHQSVNAIARHFLATKQDALTRLLGLAAPPPEPVRVPEAIAMPAPAPAPAAPATRDIAIVGLSGRYPQADTVEQFWARLRDGITCTGEIPAERWDWRQYHAEERGSKDGSYSRWGGFLSDVDKFDPLFFRITPAEAEAMDPQARLFLEQAHACIEDAGYTPASLSVDGRVGVFAGVMNAHYPGAAAYWSVANRVSYLFDFTGPSMAVDTACSSALTAIHLAIESIHSGACDCAIAGGVNLILDPQHYLDLTAMNMLSSSAQCRAFGAGADGFVDAEGVGAVLLKPLAQARQDGDQIYGVIKASMLNAGGRTNGYTVPNPAAQARLVAEALTRADVPARAVSYVEAHGTGTALGDPIEVEGLARAFGRTTNATQFCALGSVKSNIGHCESAAGIAGLTKVLLQMKHRQLVPTLHAELSNTEIDFSATPFYLQRELAPWTRPRVRVDGKVVEYPRIASISSFGAGGANALLVVQEEVREDGHADAGAVEKGAVLVPLSAKDDERLRAYAARLADALGRGALADRRLADIAYTLQVGREAMPARLALVVSSCEELAGKLARFARHDGEAEALAGCHRGTVGHRVERADVLAAHGADEAQLRRWTETGDHARLAALWVDGVAVDWTALKRSGRPRRISLPTYPFARERYWKAAPAVAPAAPASDSVSARTRLFEPVWEPSPVETGQGGHDFTARHLILCDLAQAPADLLTRALAPTSVVRIDAGTGGPDQRFASVAEQAFDAVRAVLRARTQGPVLIQIAFASEGADALFAGLDGLLRTAELENTRVVGQLIDVGAGQDGAAIVEQLRREGAQASVRRIRYRDGVREAAGWRALPFMGAHAPAPWRPDGVYLVSGGLGGLGLLLAADIAPHLTTGAVVLVGRSAPSARARARLDRFGSRVACLQADVASQSEVNTLVETIVQRYGKLTGVIHAAGVTRDSVMLNKTLDEWRAVYAAKVHGVACLDEATAGLALDFFALFSSAAAVLGNIGQADYASANGFLDAYAEYRTGLARSGRRHGKTVAIDWPLWQDGGMQLSADVAQAMRDTLGVTALPTRHGMQALYQALSGASTQLLVIEGDPDKLAQRLARAPAPAAAPAGVQPVAAEPLRRRVSAALKAMYAEIIKLDAARIDASAPLENYGIDSLQIAQMNKRLDALFGEVSKTLFYEYQTLDALAAYLAEAYGAECRAWLGVEAPIPVSIPVPPPAAAPVPVAPTAMPTAVPTAEPIAIIGMSGRYPNAADLGEYWNNLAEGKDCISEIPAERWSLDGFFEPDRQRAIAQGKSYSKWGGFLDGYADFDAAFFNISPREALSIDPHERLFLQSCWEVLEDAG